MGLFQLDSGLRRNDGAVRKMSEFESVRSFGSRRLGQGLYLCLCFRMCRCLHVPSLRHAPPSSFRRRPESRRRSRDVEDVPVIARLPEKGHSRFAGMELCDWIPAFAGMTGLWGWCPGLSVCVHLSLVLYIPGRRAVTATPLIPRLRLPGFRTSLERERKK